MYKIANEVYAKLYKEVDGESTKYVWKLSTSKPTENFISLKTMRKMDESRIFEIESDFQIDEKETKKNILKIGTAKTTALIEMLMSKCDFSNAKYTADMLDIEKQISLFYEWWSFSRASEEELDVFL